jgi:pseudoazurin
MCLFITFIIREIIIMKLRKIKKSVKQAILLSTLTLLTLATSAAEYTVKLQTSGVEGAMMIMSPGHLKIEKGDVVNFIPSDPSHNAESFFIPDGATPFNTPYGKAAKVTFTEEGVYLYKCLPHTIMGMVGVIQVGSASNLEQAKKAWQTIKPTLVMNKERMDEYLSKVQ